MKDALGRIQRVLVLGGGSEIAHAVLVALLAEGPLHAVLAARRPDALETAELERLGATVERVAFDALAHETHTAFFAEAFAGDDVDVVLVAFGVLGDQEHDERDAAAAVAVAQTNYVGAVSALTHVANHLRAQGHGTAVLLSSIAGQRARRSNYVYGASKAGIDVFAQGLQLALAGEDVHVMIVRPGFVRTRMTTSLKPAPFAVGPAEVATAVVAGLHNGSAVVWAPRSMRLIALVLRLLPTRILQRA
ncbi:MAG TPA: SDR family NAD(P)-dependent oxidoreductase [Gaiellaceae bacterium]|nr:SDR family NAD(P)-dependent oxidoreductase [Gaiellaceae bacterium]